ncbi:MAG: hypothetical protein M1832_005722 [Thelocarpon impressellum]|nr:MAG: hypothetical protein M1832_005722 [Thelocarpon impressellum]
MSTATPLNLPTPPFVHIDGVLNFRDVGGYPIAGPPPTGASNVAPTAIRRGQLYRSAEPSRITAAGTDSLRALGVKTVFDLRSTPELEKQRRPGLGGDVVEIEGVERVFAPVFANSDYSPEQVALRYRHYASDDAEGFRRAYNDILVAAPESYRTILRHLAVQPPAGACLVHCTAGKDRTGLLVALILSLCGADDTTVAHEYELTEQGLAALKPVLVEHLLKEPALEGNRQGALNLISSKFENMMATLDLIRERWGGAAGYLKLECGLNDDELEKIRKRMMVKETPLFDCR